MDSGENSNSSDCCYQDRLFEREAKNLFLCIKIREIYERVGFFNLLIGWVLALKN
jgi:hypothetical protein